MSEIVVRQTEEPDFPGIVAITRAVYPWGHPYSLEQLAFQRRAFPEGQLVAVDGAAGEVVGMAASLVINWDDYGRQLAWSEFTDWGTFRNHDSRGRTLYGAEVMVLPGRQGRGIGRRLYAARREIVQRLGLLRIRAGARLRGYHETADAMGAEEYARRVVRGELGDRTLSFQLSEGFRVIAVAPGYLPNDPESLGYAAVIEWLNPAVARPEDFARQEAAFPL